MKHYNPKLGCTCNHDEYEPHRPSCNLCLPKKRKTKTQKRKNEWPPKKIFLQYFGDADPRDLDEPIDVRSHEITWCIDKIFKHDIAYVRADLATAQRRKESEG